MGQKGMMIYKIGVQIGFYSKPYETYNVLAHDEKEALSIVSNIIGNHCGHRFLSIIE